MALIDARGISKVFRSRRGIAVRAVDDVTLSINPGRFIAIRGPSGSGKSTLLALLSAMERTSSGELFFDGTALHSATDPQLAKVRRRGGMIFQSLALVPQLSLIDNIVYALIPRGVPRHMRRGLAVEGLERVGLADLAERRADELSGGEAQRLAVARAIAGDPQVLFADEPTSSLDDESARQVIDVLLAFHASGKSLIVASHDAHVIERASDVICLRNGRCVDGLDPSD